MNTSITSCYPGHSINFRILAIISAKYIVPPPYYSNLQPKDNNALVWLDHTCTYVRAFPLVQ